MKQILAFIPIVFTALLFASEAKTQCDMEVLIEGEFLLCPESQDTLLATEGFETYQWYKRPFSGDESEPVSGATDSFLIVSYFEDVPSYFSVEVTKDTCVLRSEEYLVDGWVFLPPFVETIGDFSVGSEGETLLCNGDSVIFKFSLDTNIQWFKDFEPIAGADQKELVVKEGGLYYAEGAVEECPEFTMELGVLLEVVKKDLPGMIPILDYEEYNFLLTNPEEFVFWEWILDGEILTVGDTLVDPFLFGDPNIDDPYFVKGVDQDGCVRWSDPIFLFINSTQDEEYMGWDIFPNPTSNRLWLEGQGSPSNLKYSIYDLGGRKLDHGELTLAEFGGIEVSHLPPANYILVLETEDQFQSILFSKK